MPRNWNPYVRNYQGDRSKSVFFDADISFVGLKPPNMKAVLAPGNTSPTLYQFPTISSVQRLLKEFSTVYRTCQAREELIKLSEMDGMLMKKRSLSTSFCIGALKLCLVQSSGANHAKFDDSLMFTLV